MAGRVAFVGSAPASSRMSTSAQSSSQAAATRPIRHGSRKTGRSDRVVAEARARSGALEESGRRGDRRRAAQAVGLPGRPPLSAAGRDSRRTDRRVAAGAVFQRRRLLPDRPVAGARARSCSSRTIAAAPDTARSSDRSTCAISASATRGTCLSGIDHLVAARPGRSRSRRRDGLEPGRLHLGVSDDEARRSLQGRSRSVPASRTG